VHESSLAKQILDAALARANEDGATRIQAIHGWVAETESLSRESLVFHFSAHARGTPAEGAALDLRLEHIRARCAACSEVYTPEYHILLCPSCGKTDAELLGTPGLGVESIDVE